MGDVRNISDAQPSDAQMEAIDRYLSGALTPAQAAAFEATLARSPELQREVQTQRRLEESLRRVVAVPSANVAAEMLAKARDARTAPLGFVGPRLRVAITVAAVLALMVGVMLFGGGMLVGGGAVPAGDAGVWDRALAAGFEPEVVMSDRRELEELIGAKLGAPIVLPERAGLAYTGIRMDVGGSPLAVGVLVKVDGRSVVLVIDHASGSELGHAPGTTGDSGGDAALDATEPARGVHRFARRLGDLTIAEWSDQPEPRVVGLVRALAPGGR